MFSVFFFFSSRLWVNKIWELTDSLVGELFEGCRSIRSITLFQGSLVYGTLMVKGSGNVLVSQQERWMSPGTSWKRSFYSRFTSQHVIGRNSHQTQGKQLFSQKNSDPLLPESQIYEFFCWFLYFHLPSCLEENWDNFESRAFNLRSFIAPEVVVLCITHTFTSTK